MSQELVAKAREIDLLYYALMDDIIASTEVWEQRDDDFSRRLYVRTIFAAVEGIIQVLKSAALIWNEASDQPLLTAEEITLLREEDVQVGRSGSVLTTRKKISLLSNFEFAFKMHAKTTNKTVQLDKAGEGWQSLQAAIKVRDRLMHPHHLKDLQVSNHDILVLEKAMSFFRGSTEPLLHREKNHG